MAWFRVDDGFFSSRKVLMIPRAMRSRCLGVWVQAGSWSSKELTDGHVPGYVLEDLGGIPEERDELIRVGLWISDGDGGIHFHDWKDYQPTREEVLAKRDETSKQRSIAGKKGMASRWGDNKITNPLQANNKAITPTRPDPTRPDLSISKEIDKGRASRIPTPFLVTEEMVDWFRSKKLTIDVFEETEKFENYFSALAGAKALKLDWAKTWQNWMMRAQGYANERLGADPWAGKEHLGFAE